MNTDIPPSFYVNLKQYRIIKTISKTFFSKISLVEENPSKQYYSVESTNPNLFLLSEIENVVRNKYHSFYIPIGFSETNFKQEEFPTILLEYMPNGSLGYLFSSLGMNLDRDTKTYIILLGIALAIRDLHRKNKALINLNPDNVLLDEYLQPHISYFGKYNIPDDDLANAYLSTYHKLPLYLAPEILNHQPYSYKADAYSFSLIAYQIITGTIPYESLLKKDANEFKEKVINGFRPDLSLIPDEEIRNFLKWCWDPNPIERQGFNDIVDSITSYSFYKIFNIDHKEVFEYLHNFGDECNNLISIFKQNDPDLDQSEIDFLISETHQTERAIFNASAYIQGNALTISENGKNFDDMVTILMSVSGHKRRTVEIYLYFKNKMNLDFNYELNNYLGPIGFGSNDEPIPNDNDLENYDESIAF